ncbi:hypothetical protein MINT15_15520 [Saccharomonospora viridis]|uniref:Uncharacterized protein n=1 Tax=Saccharomonospora viridis TaxID=1852 RepID=A0A837DAY7_9PSEU|nr:hypothetical protein MINT15_15520 [Saccharomonospora viridis]
MRTQQGQQASRLCGHTASSHSIKGSAGDVKCPKQATVCLSVNIRRTA